MTTSGASTIHHPVFSKRSLELGRAVIELKRQYESIARSWLTLNSEQRRQYVQAGMAPQIEDRTGKHVYAFLPDHFIFSALGLRPWHHACYESDGTHRLLQVDPWIVAGGFRKPEWLKMPRAEFRPLAAELNADTVAEERLLATVHIRHYSTVRRRFSG